MKLFVWCNPYDVSWGSSLLFAIADNVDAARKLAAQSSGFYSFGEYFNEMDMSHFADNLGAPTRIIDLPCVEWHEWSE